jgi:WD40 repeat protein
VAFDKSGKSLLVGCSDGEIKVVSVDKNEVISNVKAHEGGVHSVLVN